MGHISGPGGGGAATVRTFTTAANGATMQPGETYLIAKLAQTSFNTDAITADPDFQVTNLPAGMYGFQMFGVFQGGADGSRVGILPAGMYGTGIGQCGGGGAGAGIVGDTGGMLCGGANEWRVSLIGGTPIGFAGGTIAIGVRTNTVGGATSFFLPRSWFSLTRIN